LSVSGKRGATSKIYARSFGFPPERREVVLIKIEPEGPDVTARPIIKTLDVKIP
jgi:hypothetical protein